MKVGRLCGDFLKEEVFRLARGSLRVEPFPNGGSCDSQAQVNGVLAEVALVVDELFEDLGLCDLGTADTGGLDSIGELLDNHRGDSVGPGALGESRVDDERRLAEGFSLAVPALHVVRHGRRLATVRL